MIPDSRRFASDVEALPTRQRQITRSVAIPGRTPGLTASGAPVDTIGPGVKRWNEEPTQNAILPAVMIAQASAPRDMPRRRIRYRKTSLFRPAGNMLSWGALRAIVPMTKVQRQARIPAGNAPGFPVRRMRVATYDQRTPNLLSSGGSS